MLRKLKELVGNYPVADHRNVHVISIHFPEGFTRTEVNKFKVALGSADFSHLMQPSTVQAYYAITDGSEERVQLDKKRIEALRSESDIRQFHYGESCGECLGEFNAKGLLVSAPFGEIITEANRKATNQNEIA